MYFLPRIFRFSRANREHGGFQRHPNSAYIERADGILKFGTDGMVKIWIHGFADIKVNNDV